VAVNLDKEKLDQFHRATAAAWSAGKLKHFKPKSSMGNQNVEEIYQGLSTETLFQPVKGNALWAMFTLFSPPSSDEFLVSIHDASVCTNKRLVIKCSVPGDYQEINLSDVRKADFRKSKQGIIKFIMNSDQIMELSGIPYNFKTLEEIFRRGAFAQP
jgi:hypothetical protein